MDARFVGQCVRTTQNDWKEAGRLYRQALDIRRGVSAENQALADSLAHQGDLLLHEGDVSGQRRIDDAIEMYRRVLTDRMALIGPCGEWRVALQPVVIGVAQIKLSATFNSISAALLI